MRKPMHICQIFKNAGEIVQRCKRIRLQCLHGGAWRHVCCRGFYFHAVLHSTCRLLLEVTKRNLRYRNHNIMKMIILLLCTVNMRLHKKIINRLLLDLYAWLPSEFILTDNNDNSGQYEKQTNRYVNRQTDRLSWAELVGPRLHENHLV